ncbi:MAG: tRNA preQ1(34) S-adenosylmethionine ribosyltransferase-isomerase QueA [Rickettsiales bacterium]|nr:MAG: tRNA preQ1(34) S-adenosylmethionine ribosyltransferase-isomerase QueA [Rickettsiales bacterium]
MKLQDFDFDLPQELIAQQPALQRDHSNLLIPNEGSNKIVKFYDLINYLRAGDLMIFNNSRVINAKLLLQKDNNKIININLNKPINDFVWLGFARPSKNLIEGEIFQFGKHRVIIRKKLEFGEVEIEFVLDNMKVFDFLDLYGMIPLPQYIKRTEKNDEDKHRYQNIYSQIRGSVANSTAGLHFTEELMEKIKALNVEIDFVTLHVGAGTFLPVKTENILEHKMHSEWCEVSRDTADKINKAKREKRRVIVVGTTSMRTIESCSVDGVVIPQSKETNIFIKPGYKFQIADLMLTNFHLPKSTLFMLVCAFAGMDKIKALYNYAIESKMRFFSYGDAMLIKKE